MPEFIDVPLSVAAAQVLQHWLNAVPAEFVPVTHAAERQALADLLTALEMAAPPETAADLADARAVLLRDAGDWVNRGPTYSQEPGYSRARQASIR